MENNGIFLADLPIHKRFDGQNLHFLPPKNIATDMLSVEGAYLVFPRYVAGEPTEIKPITTLEALDSIMNSRYGVKDSYDEATISQWIGLVESFKKYTITYSDMEDARQHLEKLITA